MSTAYYVVFSFPFFLVSNNTDRTGCKLSCAGLDEGKGIEKGKGGRRKALVCNLAYVCLPRCFIKTSISEQSRPCHLRDIFQPFKKRINRISLKKEWSSSNRREIGSTNTSECRQRFGCTENGFILHSNNLRML